ncbi:MAG: LytTR family transcriptional regulator [Sphingomonas bacterium]|nr:LytTR family transcriptional regulator [Sphingomonas bacterium]
MNKPLRRSGFEHAPNVRWSRFWSRANRPLTPVARDGIAILLVFSSYYLAFAATSGNWTGAVYDALRNAMVLVAVAAAARLLIGRLQDRLGGVVALAAHAFAAVSFSLIWYWVLMLTAGFVSARSLLDFDVRSFFPEPASVWQLLQGVIVYLALAAIERADRQSRQAVELSASPSRASSPLRYFIKRDGDALPVDVDQIVAISGADDYAEVTTVSGTHLVRLTLASFEDRLDPLNFCRIHRSLIVNVRRIERFEPDGSGRLSVWMDNGRNFRSSRVGAAKLRERLI